jgi:hypothetical protein
MSGQTQTGHNAPTTTENHVMGFLDSRKDCEALVDAMKREGLGSPVMHTFDGLVGLEALEAMLKGSWGEAEQAFYEKALAELENGHSAISLEVPDLEEAARIGKLAGRLGGRSFTHFGVMVDTGIET